MGCGCGSRPKRRNADGTLKSYIYKFVAPGAAIDPETGEPVFTPYLTPIEAKTAQRAAGGGTVIRSESK